MLKENLVQDYLKKTALLIDNHLDSLIQKTPCPHENLFSAARYSLMSGGKRLRPILLIATAEAFGCEAAKTLSAASALEMVHTYSMIHDDLPCMDDDDFRRGRPSLHRAFPEAHAVLTGDFLLTYAFEVIATDPLLTNEQKIKLIALLAKNSGGEGMVAGQILDIEAEGKDIDHETLQMIHRYKTGALLTASVEMGGIISMNSEETLFALRAYGNDVGLAFQIIDDILDFSLIEKQKEPISSDLIKDKMTYVKLLGPENAKKKALALAESAKNHLKALPVKTQLLNQLADFIVHRTQ